MASANHALGAVVLIAAGVYQWTPLKDMCLTQCQTPLLFLMRHGGFRQDDYFGRFLSDTGFPNQFFDDSWVVGLWRG